MESIPGERPLAALAGLQRRELLSEFVNAGSDGQQLRIIGGQICGHRLELDLLCRNLRVDLAAASIIAFDWASTAAALFFI